MPFTIINKSVETRAIIIRKKQATYGYRDGIRPRPAAALMLILELQEVERISASFPFPLPLQKYVNFVDQFVGRHRFRRFESRTHHGRRGGKSSDHQNHHSA